MAALVAAGVLALDVIPEDAPRVAGLIVELVAASAAGLAVYLLYSRVMRLPELPRTMGLLRSALRGR
jgi:uncharacterized membrane-anchored protein